MEKSNIRNNIGIFNTIAPFCVGVTFVFIAVLVLQDSQSTVSIGSILSALASYVFPLLITFALFVVAIFTSFYKEKRLHRVEGLLWASLAAYMLFLCVYWLFVNSISYSHAKPSVFLLVLFAAISGVAILGAVINYRFVKRNHLTQKQS